ncbi:MAG: YfiR family protein [Proteobacteria bacterium]|nr:YfiR family protein [Pseudomonadota bacterium]
MIIHNQNKYYKVFTANKVTKYILWVILILMISVSIPSSLTYASESLNTESKLKAAFIYNFAKFVDWPATESKDTSSQPFVIGVLGRDPIIEKLLTIEGKLIKGRKLSVRTLSDIKEINDCQVVFISTSEKNNLIGILNAIKNKEVLTVSDIKNFVDEGGNIGFVRVENKIRFDINLKTAEKSNLKIRSDLLSLARRIIN